MQAQGFPDRFRNAHNFGPARLAHSYGCHGDYSRSNNGCYIVLHESVLTQIEEKSNSD